MVTILKPDLSFYWLPSRAWELLAGAALASHRSVFAEAPKGRREAAAAAGLMAILASYALVDLSDVAHPGLVTLPVVLGAVLIIGCAGVDTIVGRLLSARPMVWLGVISYSLYLWHYPIMAFGRHLAFTPTLIDKIFWIALSIILAHLTMIFVERPFRNRSGMSLPLAAASIGLASVAIVAVGFLIAKQDGWPSRMAHLSASYGEETHDNQKLRVASWGPLRRLGRETGGAQSNAFGPSPDEMSRLWFLPDETRTRVLLAGNSHAKDLFNAVKFGTYGEKIAIARFGLNIDLREAHVSALRRSPNYAAAEIIVLAHSYNTDELAPIEAFIKAVAGDGKKLVVLGKRPVFKTFSPYPLADQWFLRQGPDVDGQALASEAYRIAEFFDDFNERLAAIAVEAGATFVSQDGLMCDLAAKTCPMLTADGRKILYDSVHFSLQGARHLGDRMAELAYFGK